VVNSNRAVAMLWRNFPALILEVLAMKTTLTRLPLLALGILALLAALWAGLLRLGWEFPPILAALRGLHGPLMISGFLGTVINLERAVALNDRRYLLAPLLSGLGSLVLLTNLAPELGTLLLTLGSVGLAIIFLVILRRHAGRDTIVMAIGVGAWVIGNFLWLAGNFISLSTLWWLAFLTLTILGERLELSRLLRLPRIANTLFDSAVAIFLIGALLDFGENALGTGSDLGTRIAGVGMIAIAAWLLRYDIARKTVKQTGLTRYIAICLLTGYVWLGIGGALRVIYGGVTGGAIYDATLHAILLGYVFSMIFGHAPIIFPAILNRAIPYSPMFYAHLVLLHGSLVLRAIGDLGNLVVLRQWGGMINAIAILLFLGMTVRGVVLGARARRV
jgi:hypothetical protein